MSAAKAFKSIILGRISFNCQVEQSFAARFSLEKPETLILLRT